MKFFFNHKGLGQNREGNSNIKLATRDIMINKIFRILAGNTNEIRSKNFPPRFYLMKI